MKTVGNPEAALVGRGGRFVLGEPLTALWEGFSSLQRTLPVASRWKRRCAKARINSDCSSTPLPKVYTELTLNTDARSATPPASELWDTSAWTKCSARIYII